MPIKIIALQRRFAEQGRIRLGYKQGGNGRPVKLEKFRFTSPSEQHIKDLADLYGGEAKAWDNHGKPEFEVHSDVKSIPVIAVKGGLSQWLETWSGGGCVHRCDGEVNVLTNEPCNPDDPAHVNAKPTTRLSLMLPELESIGVWRLESHGWNAAAEIPAVAELAQFVGDLVPASLDLVERRAIKDGKTSRFVVPVLDLKIATHRLRELVEAKVNGAPALTSADQRPALASGLSNAPQPDYRAQADEATSVAQVRAIWKEYASHGVLDTDLEAYLTQRVTALQPSTAPATEPDADGVVDAEIVEDGNGDDVWAQIVKAGGDRGYSLPDLQDSFAERMGGITADSASPAELRQFLALLQQEKAA